MKFLVTEKTHATPKPKKRFPMYIDYIQFLTTRAGWKAKKVYSHYTFEQNSLKKDFVLGNQRARQEAVTKWNDVQANFYKLMSNSNFGFDCRDTS